MPGESAAELTAVGAEKLVGRRVRRYFLHDKSNTEGAWYHGTVVGPGVSSGGKGRKAFCSIEYDNGDTENMSASDLSEFIVPKTEKLPVVKAPPLSPPPSAPRAPRASPKPKATPPAAPRLKTPSKASTPAAEAPAAKRAKTTPAGAAQPADSTPAPPAVPAALPAPAPGRSCSVM